MICNALVVLQISATLPCITTIDLHDIHNLLNTNKRATAFDLPYKVWKMASRL